MNPDSFRRAVGDRRGAPSVTDKLWGADPAVSSPLRALTEQVAGGDLACGLFALGQRPGCPDAAPHARKLVDELTRQFAAQQTARLRDDSGVRYLLSAAYPLGLHLWDADADATDPAGFAVVQEALAPVVRRHLLTAVERRSVDVAGLDIALTAAADAHLAGLLGDRADARTVDALLCAPGETADELGVELDLHRDTLAGLWDAGVWLQVLTEWRGVVAQAAADGQRPYARPGDLAARLADIARWTVSSQSATARTLRR